MPIVVGRNGRDGEDKRALRQFASAVRGVAQDKKGRNIGPGDDPGPMEAPKINELETETGPKGQRQIVYRLVEAGR
jgi:hypothetical protein